jgi:hypothetical protein
MHMAIAASAARQPSKAAMYKVRAWLTVLAVDQSLVKHQFSVCTQSANTMTQVVLHQTLPLGHGMNCCWWFRHSAFFSNNCVAYSAAVLSLASNLPPPKAAAAWRVTQRGHLAEPARCIAGCMLGYGSFSTHASCKFYSMLGLCRRASIKEGGQ